MEREPAYQHIDTQWKLPYTPLSSLCRRSWQAKPLSEEENDLPQRSLCWAGSFVSGGTPSSFSKALKEPLVQSVPQNTLQFNSQREDVNNSGFVNWRLLQDPLVASVLSCCRVCEVWCVETLGGGRPCWEAAHDMPGDRERGSPSPIGVSLARNDIAAGGSHYSHHRQLASSLRGGQ